MAHTRVELPRVAREFLRTESGRWCKPAIRLLHRWIFEQRIDLTALTETHIEQFWQQRRLRGVATVTLKNHSYRVNRYLRWLHSKGVLSFEAGRENRKPIVLPRAACAFIDTLRPVRKPSTCKGYAVDLRDIHAWLDEQELSVDTLDRGGIEHWLGSLAARGLLPVTRYGRIINVRTYFRWLSEKGESSADPDDLLRSDDLPKIPTLLPRPFPVEADRELQRRFMESGTPCGQALFIMRRSGIRIGELVRLDPDCLDEDFHGNTFLKVPLGKLDNERLVPLDDESREIVMALRQIASGDRFLILPVLSRETLKKQLTAALKDAAFGLDIPGQIVSHRLRHTYATELLNAGMSLVGIMKLLGHRSLNMTMRYAALTQHTVVKDYYKAMAQIARQYELPTATSSCTIDKPNPDRMLRDVISHLRKNALAGSNTQRLIARIHKLRHEIAHLDTAPCSPMKHPCARKQSAG